MIVVLVALVGWCAVAVVLGRSLGRRRRRRGARPGPLGAPRWAWWTGVTALVLATVVIVGTIVRLPYYTVAPGSALDVNDLVTVSGAPSHPADGELLLLFVRQRARVNAWRWLQAWLDDDVDLYRESDFSPDQSPEDLRTIAQADMERSQINARRIALERLGYEVPLAEDGVVVLGVFSDRPAGGVLERGDVVLAADGEVIEAAEQLGEIVRERPPGDDVEVRFRRAGEVRTATIATVADPEDRAVIGVFVSRSYDFPVDIELDTGSIGGPSAGLAMTLSILDELTPGELTGGTTVAVTGEIREDGSVGRVGGVTQKAVSARRAGAVLFLVPACPDPSTLVDEGFTPGRAQVVSDDCDADLSRARHRAADLRVVPVATLDDALRALERAGGEALPLDGAEPRSPAEAA